MQKSKIIFISHDASRTGAPIVLLHLLKWLKANSNIEFITIIKNPTGPLLEEFNKVSKVYTHKSNKYHPDSSLKSILKRRIKKILKPFSAPSISSKALVDFSPSIVYGNTVVTCDIALDIQNYFSVKPKVICHIHELDIAIDKYFGKKKFDALKHKVDYFIAVSEAVKKNLLVNHHIKPANIFLVKEFIPAKEYSSLPQEHIIKSQMGFQETDTILMGCGTIDWRKSPDLFVQVAAYVLKKSTYSNVFFVWVGGELDSVDYEHLQHDIDKLQLQGKIKFIGIVKNPIDYIGIADLFLMTSREDPYPLVCLEAASRAVPVICFENAGGIPEFVETDAGIIVPFIDTAAMGEAVVDLIHHPEKRNELGKQAQQKVQEKHDVSIAAKEIIEIFKNI